LETESVECRWDGCIARSKELTKVCSTICLNDILLEFFQAIIEAWVIFPFAFPITLQLFALSSSSSSSSVLRLFLPRVFADSGEVSVDAVE